MKLKELHLTNFRGFEQLDIVFPNRLAVFMGVNGAGKSAVLEAICICFIQLVQGLTMHNDFEKFKYSNRNIKKGKDFAILKFKLGHLNLENLDLEIALNNKSPISLSNLEYRDILEYFYKIREVNNNDENLPIFIHFQSTKEDISINSLSKHKRVNLDDTPYSAYDNAFFHSISSFSDFINWFKEAEDRENELIIQKKDFSFETSELSSLRYAIATFLFHLNKKTSFGDLKINREFNSNSEFKANGSYSLTAKKGNDRFDLSQLSEGEKTVIMLVCDIARRLTIVNLQNPLEGEGIVLIDEIDLHLHPQWQREVIPALLATFPNLQFIVTTHSPQVLSKVHKESIFILEDGKLVKNVPNTYGRNASAILFEIFGVTDRPEEVQEKINRCSQLMEEENYAAAKVLLKELTELLGENDEAVVGARTQLLFDNQMVEG